MAFEVTIDQTNTPISEGETLIVDYTVTNTGASTETQDLELHIVSPTAVIDDFERSTLDHYTGETADFSLVDESTVTPNAINGTRLLQDVAGGEINSTAGLDNYFAKGESAIVYIYGENLVTNAKAAYTFWGSSDTTLDGYALNVREHSSANIRLIEWTSGGSSILGTANPALTDDIWYRLEIVWDDGTLGGADNDLTVDVYEHATDTLIATVTGNDSTHATNTGIGFRGQQAGWFWDYYHKP